METEARFSSSCCTFLNFGILFCVVCLIRFKDAIDLSRSLHQHLYLSITRNLIDILLILYRSYISYLVIYRLRRDVGVRRVYHGPERENHYLEKLSRGYTDVCLREVHQTHVTHLFIYLIYRSIDRSKCKKNIYNYNACLISLQLFALMLVCVVMMMMMMMMMMMILDLYFFFLFCCRNEDEENILKPVITDDGYTFLYIKHNNLLRNNNNQSITFTSVASRVESSRVESSRCVVDNDTTRHDTTQRPFITTIAFKQPLTLSALLMLCFVFVLCCSDGHDEAQP